MSARAPAAVEDTALWDALGTSVLVRVSDARSLARARVEVERELDAIDRACSRFRDDSELARVNARSGRTHRVSPLLAEALALALRAAALTDGDVDPTVGRALELAGYDRDWALIAGGREDGNRDMLPQAGPGARTPAVSARVRSGWRVVELDPLARTVRVPAGVRLDVGATAKAWVSDRAARAAAAAGGCGALVSVGGDVATAGEAPAGGWRIHVTDDHRSTAAAPGQTVAIRSGGLATSSVAVRRWSAHGASMHHIIDPSTGAPARSCWRTVSVAARDCAEANIAATAAIVRGAGALAWLEAIGLPARLVDHRGRASYAGAWPRERASSETAPARSRREPAAPAAGIAA